MKIDFKYLTKLISSPICRSAVLITDQFFNTLVIFPILVECSLPTWSTLKPLAHSEAEAIPCIHKIHCLRTKYQHYKYGNEAYLGSKSPKEKD